MGRPAWSSRITVEDCLKLDIKRMKQAGDFEKGAGSSWTITWTKGSGFKSSVRYGLMNIDGKLHLWFDYTITNRASDKKKEMDYFVELSTTECNFGGTRYWFTCPLTINDVPCNRRVGTLYLPPNGEHFGCRHCYNLTYECQKEHDKSADAFRKLSMARLMQSMDSKNPKIAIRAIKESFRREKLWNK